jgi:hypothetical protein
LLQFLLANGVPENQAIDVVQANSLPHCDLVLYDARVRGCGVRAAAS